jgi:hypothetical protein
VRGEHQFDFQAPQLPGQGFGAVAFALQAGEQFRQYARSNGAGCDSSRR